RPGARDGLPRRDAVVAELTQLTAAGATNTRTPCAR
ncbi:MAG: hypothetical protein QOG76_744, partial [Pseudonocardiales bacterium]|nr:hypothetical protein [Pseudonocardiales bacterium]